jgi:hypothetical protein
MATGLSVAEVIRTAEENDRPGIQRGLIEDATAAWLGAELARFEATDWPRVEMFLSPPTAKTRISGSQPKAPTHEIGNAIG